MGSVGRLEGPCVDRKSIKSSYDSALSAAGSVNVIDGAERNIVLRLVSTCLIHFKIRAVGRGMHNNSIEG